jgi:hypothetical protein
MPRRIERSKIVRSVGETVKYVVAATITESQTIGVAELKISPMENSTHDTMA